MDIYQLFEQTAALQFACQKLQSGMASEETAASKEDLRGRVLQILDRVSSLCEAHQTESLEELFAHFESIFDKYRLDQVFDGQLEFVILFEGQKAHLFQTLSKFEPLSETLSRLESLYLKVLNCSPDDLSVDFMSVPNLHFPGHRQVFGNRVLNLIKMALGLAQVYLQHTAVYSQMNLHPKALASAEKACDLVFRVVDRITEIFGFFRQFGVSSTDTLEAFSGQINDFAVYFDFLKRAKTFLKEARESNKSNELLWRMSSDATLKQLLQRIMSLKEPSSQASLGRKLPVDDLNTFHISALVKMPPFLEAVKSLEQARFDEKLLNRISLVLTSSIFSIATENRFVSFLEIQEEVQRPQASLADAKTQKCETVSKEYKLHTNRRFILSERIHLIALDILTFGYPDSCKLAFHFFQSYKKNYSVDIFVIEEEDEQSFSTAKTARLSEVQAATVPETGPAPAAAAPMKFIKISLNKQNLDDFKKKPKTDLPANENLETLNKESASATSPLLPFQMAASGSSSGWTVSTVHKELLKGRQKTRDIDSTRSKNLASTSLSTKEVDVGSLHLSSVDRFKPSWNGFETQKKPMSRQMETNFAKKGRPESYLTLLTKQKSDFLAQIKDSKKEVEMTTNSKTIDKSYNVKVSQTVRPKDLSLKRRNKLNGRNFSSSTDFLRSVGHLPSALPEQRESVKRGEANPRKNVDRLGIMSTKFAHMINQSTRELRAKYEGKLKEKVTGLVSVYPSKVQPGSLRQDGNLGSA
jgi:hypothetical protein